MADVVGTHVQGGVTAEAFLEEHQLLKTLRWYDGLALGTTVPVGAFAVVGASIGVLGAGGAAALWAISAIIGALQSWIYSETAAMFPEKPGGIALYAHEGWRRYFSPVGALATFGYWFAWSSVLAIFGIVIGDLAQTQWFPHATWTFWDGAVHVGLPHLIGIGVVVFVWIINSLGIRPAVWMSYVLALLMLIPFAVLMILPFITGNFHSSFIMWHLSSVKVALVWLYVMGWSAYSAEMCASFAPEYRDVTKDTAKALKSTALFTLIVFAILPVSSTGIVGEKAVIANPVSYFVQAFDTIVGSGASSIMVGLLIVGLILVMNGSTADGSRALYGIARDGMTIKQLYHLNRFKVPGRAMTVDMVVNTLLILFVGNTLAILVAGNLGYILAHVFALSGFLLLRRDRPNWPRPIRMATGWVAVAAFLLVLNIVLVALGVTNSQITGYGGLKDTLIGVGVLLTSLVFFLFRRKVQDRVPLGLREPTPRTPDEDTSIPGQLRTVLAAPDVGGH